MQPWPTSSMGISSSSSVSSFSYKNRILWNKNVDIKFSVCISGITFIRYPQNRKNWKPNLAKVTLCLKIYPLQRKCVATCTLAPLKCFVHYHINISDHSNLKKNKIKNVLEINKVHVKIKQYLKYCVIIIWWNLFSV